MSSEKKGMPNIWLLGYFKRKHMKKKYQHGKPYHCVNRADFRNLSSNQKFLVPKLHRAKATCPSMAQSFSVAFPRLVVVDDSDGRDDCICGWRYGQ